MIDVMKRHKITFFVLALILLLLLAIFLYFNLQESSRIPMKGVFVAASLMGTIV